MRTYKVSIEGDHMVVTVISQGASVSTVVIPMLDHDAMEEAFEELLDAAYLDGKTDERNGI